MNNLVQTFVERYPDWLTALWEHLQISLVSILIGIVIAVPLGILTFQHQKTKEWVLQFTGVFQTIPSLALLGLFIPFLGIGKLPAIVALVIYAIFPIVQSTVTGLDNIDPNLEEAARAFGMSKREKLITYQFEISFPYILAGIRTTTVMVIGTATLASLIGAGGLGSFILLGIDRNNSSLILIGAISSALLAILFNYGLQLLSRLSMKRILAIFVALCIATAGSFVPQLIPSGRSQQTLVVAGKLGPEPEILMNMYKILIEQDTDISVEIKPNFGKTSFLYEALKSGDIDIYPEFTGTITSSLLTTNPTNSTDENTVYKAARDGIYSQDKLVLLKPMKYENTFAIAVPAAFAQKYHLSSISDLHSVESFAKAGFTLEFNDREDGNRGLKSVYGLNLNTSTMEPSLRYQAIKNGDVQIIEVYSTDPEIQRYNLKILHDDKKLFPPYQGAPLMREETLKKYPQLEEILNQLAGKITESDMSRMNYEVAVKEKSAYRVAYDYLSKSGLIK